MTAARSRFAHTLPAVLAALVGGIFTAVLYGLADRLENRQLQERFDRQVENSRQCD